MPLQGIDIHPLRLAKNAATGGEQMTQRAAVANLPRRPDSNVVSDAIPLFFIGRNNDGFWVARAADRRIGGLFLRKQSALRFSQQISKPLGCAIMMLPEGLELDIENRGGRVAACLGLAKRVLRRHAPWLEAISAKVPSRVRDALQIWLALAMVAALMWLLITVLTAIPQALSAPLIASPGHASMTFMPPL
jgi:hypothetical protein